MNDTSCKVRKARVDRSSKLPMGTATTKSRPAFSLVALVIALCSYLLVVSCQGVGEIQPPPDEQQKLSETDELVALALVTSPEADPMVFLRATRALTKDGMLEQAGALAERVRLSADAMIQLSSDEQHEIRIYAIRGYVTIDPRQALDLALLWRPLETTWIAQRERLLSEAYVQLGEFELATQARHRSLRESLEFSPIETNQFWRLVIQVPMFRQRDLAAIDPNPRLRAWWELGFGINRQLTTRTQHRAYLRWRARHPEHPAALFPPKPLLNSVTELKRVALVLPLSGALGNAAEAIQNGFMFGYLESIQSFPQGSLQEVLVYDTGKNSLDRVARSALRDGAQIIAGPLTKPSVAKLLEMDLEIPVLALNRVEALELGVHSSPAKVYQLAVAIEDDARAIAREVADNGHKRIIVFEGDRDWSRRAMQSMSASLPSSISVVATGRINRIEVITAVVGETMGVAASNERFEDVRRAVGTSVEFQPRTREDVDAIVALIDAEELDSVLAALRFHFADEIPLYVPSPAVRGWDPSDLADGMRLTNLPLLLAPSPMISDLIAAFRPDFSALPFYALGIDAYRLINQWSRLEQGELIQGSVGALRADAGGVIVRTPMWGTIVNRTAVPDF